MGIFVGALLRAVAELGLDGLDRLATRRCLTGNGMPIPAVDRASFAAPILSWPMRRSALALRFGRTLAPPANLASKQLVFTPAAANASTSAICQRHLGL